MNSISLSRRLLQISSFVPEGKNTADIGSDHALIPSYLAMEQISPYIIAGEVNEGPYRAAIKQVTGLQLEQKISVRKGDGLSVINNVDEIKVVIIAGMGGALIKDILDIGKEKLKTVERLILQPNIAENNVREWLAKNGWLIITEEIIEEDNRIYEIIVAERDNGTKENSYSELPFSEEVIYYFGPVLLSKGSEILKKKWQLELEKRIYILNQLESRARVDDKERKISEFKEEIKNIKEVLDWLEKDRISSKY